MISNGEDEVVQENEFLIESEQDHNSTKNSKKKTTSKIYLDSC